MMICYRCQCSITQKTRRVQVREGICTTTYCRHCYKAIGGE
jgi:hypothetical protein